MCTNRANSSTHAQRTRRASKVGFSLIELIMVITIISILAAIAVPRYAGALARYRVEAAAKRIIAEIEFTRQHARSTSTSTSIRIRVDTDLVEIFGVQDPDDPSSSNTVTFLDRAPYRADVVSSGFNGNEIVIFDGYGVPDSGGTVVLTVGSESRTVVLDADTGKAVVQ